MQPKLLLTYLSIIGLALFVACVPSTSSSDQAPVAAATAAATATSGSRSSPSPTGDTPRAAAPAPTSTAPPATSPATSKPQPTVTLSPPAISTPGAAIALQPIATGLDRPLYVTHAGDGSGRLFVVGKGGTIVVLREGYMRPEPFLDITDRVSAQENERGLLSVAFHPRYSENGFLYVNYTDRNGDTTVSRFHATGETADPNSEVALLKIEQPYSNHNGGLVSFGPDGYLYVGMGDGGSGGDPQGNGQNLNTLLGKLLRIDVDRGEPYAIPADNPWASGDGGRSEIWAYGLRNPWRFSFDRVTGDLYIADVGQGAYEEVNVQRAGSPGGENYGWNTMEGQHCFRGQGCDRANLVVPITEYGRDGGCSITGGYVYRGASIPSIQGAYFFGDYCSGRIWSLRETPERWEVTQVLDSGLNISSFGEDQVGELYITNLRGGLYQVVEAP